MPPQAEPNNMVVDEPAPETQRNVTFAVNYEVSLADDFVAQPPRRRATTTTTPTAEGSRTSNVLRRHSNGGVENKTPNNHVSSSSSEEEETAVAAQSLRRSSTRDKQGKREVSLARTRIRYDMETVPTVERNADFLACFRKWWTNSSSNNNATTDKNPNRRSSRLHSVAVAAGDQEQSDGPLAGRFCQNCDAPFLNHSSVVWVPNKRSEWEDTIHEMTALCATAARRRPRVVDKKESAALSKEYISDRVDIDDPINGFQIRHAVGGWLQGFIMWTNFTTWTHYFRWDSLHPQSGLVGATGPYLDVDGSLSRRLQSLPRTGDPLVSGVIFESVAEIGLVGGLKCGEILLRMALDDIRAKKQYKFVVLQATDSSQGFYERFGFVRVGAICRYHQSNSNSNASRKKPPHQLDAPVEAGAQEEPVQQPGGETMENAQNQHEPPIVGYRHWTHANESNVSLEMHGGPSYMMCLALPENDESIFVETKEQTQYKCGTCSRAISPPASFLESIMRFSSMGKPAVEQLSSGAMLSKALQRKASSVSVSSSPAASPAVQKKIVRKPINLIPIPEERPVQPPTTPATLAAPTNGKVVPSSKKPKRKASDSDKGPPSKRQKSAVASSSPSKSSDAPLIQPKSSDNPTPDVITAEQPVKRGRGRPRKHKPPPDAGEAMAEPPVKRGRGRPRKNKLPPDTGEAAKPASKPANQPAGKAVKPASQPAAAEPPVKRGRGRPKGSGKKKNVASSSAAPKVVPVSRPVRAKPAPTVVAKVAQRQTPEKEEEDERTFYSVRGSDGRFKRVPIDGVAVFESASNKKPLSRDPNPPRGVVTSKRELPKRNATVTDPAPPPPPHPARKHKPLAPKKRHKRIDPDKLRKQKVKAYPRDRPHYYNRVVKSVQKKRGRAKEYFFVLEYNENTEGLRLVPLEVNGTLMGKRQGRPRFQCSLGDTDKNFVSATTSEYEVVSAAMVMKTPLLAQEAWDIEDD